MGWTAQFRLVFRVRNFPAAIKQANVNTGVFKFTFSCARLWLVCKACFVHARLSHVLGFELLVSYIYELQI